MAFIKPSAVVTGNHPLQLKRLADSREAAAHPPGVRGEADTLLEPESDAGRDRDVPCAGFKLKTFFHCINFEQMTSAGDSKLGQALQLILPKEHGSWSLAMEPLVLGMLAAPSRGGAALAAGAAAVFFLRRPINILLAGKRDSRRRLAWVCVFVLLAVSMGATALAVNWGGLRACWPLLPASMAGLMFVWCDSRGVGRESAAELAGATAFGVLPAAFASLAGWSAGQSCVLAFMMLVRGVPTVLCVRTYLRLKKGQDVSVLPSLAIAMTGLIFMVWLSSQGYAAWAASVFAAILAVRAVLLLVWHPTVSARRVGVFEAVFGAVYVISLGALAPATR